MNLFASDLLEQPGAREIPIIIKGGQRNSKNLRCLLVGHASEIPRSAALWLCEPHARHAPTPQPMCASIEIWRSNPRGTQTFAVPQAAVREVIETVPPGFEEELPKRVLVHPSGFRQSPYADIKPPGEDGRNAKTAARKEAGKGSAAPRKLWHSSPGSSGG